jgi:cytochrome c553
MLDHFADATSARDAVIAGRLADVRAPLQRLAATETRDLPDDWAPWFDEMRAVAARGARATTLGAAADSVAELGATCGECHRTTHGGPVLAEPPSYDPQGQKGLQEKMARHRFAADELWFGLTGPEHRAWSSGASALMNINVPSLVSTRGVPAAEDRAPGGQGELQGKPDPRMPDQDKAEQAERAPAPAGTVDLDPELRALRELGQRADQASIGVDKKQVFAEVIARCGACHDKLQVEL